MREDKKQKIPIHQYPRGENLTPEETRLRTRHLLENLSVDLGEVSKELDRERILEIHYLMNNLVRWIEQKLDIKVSRDIIPKILTRIKIYDKDTWEKIRDKKSMPEGWTAGNDLVTSQTFAKEEDDQNETMANICHELIHALSRRLIVKEKNETGEQIFDTHLLGYENTNNTVFSFLNEVTTELMNIEVLDFYKNQPGGKNYSVTGGIAYLEGVMFLDTILEEFAKKSGITSDEIRKRLYRGCLLGDTRQLKIFNDTLGPNTLKVLSRSGQEPEEEPLNNATFVKNLASDLIKLNIDPSKFLEKIDRYRKGLKVKLSSGIEI